ncbi:MAG TPA: hypothetical protein VFW63_01005 [Acidimicrobiales bacterium]|nr:hypothetical protein [Acidimicrobiales bacterium]
MHLADERREAESEAWFLQPDEGPELEVETGISSNLAYGDLGDLGSPDPTGDQLARSDDPTGDQLARSDDPTGDQPSPGDDPAGDQLAQGGDGPGRR